MQISTIATNLGSGVTLRRYTLTYLDFQTTSGSGAKTFALDTLPAHGIVLGVRTINKTNFAGGALSAITVAVGKSGTATFFTAAYDCFAAAGDTTVQETALFKHGQLTALPMIATVTPTSDNVSAATSGQVDIDILSLNVSSDMTTIP